MTSGSLYPRSPRITSDHARQTSNQKFLAKISHDKTNQSEISFWIDFATIPQEWLLFDSKDIASQFAAILETGPRPFKFLEGINWARHISFRVHDLRSINALNLTLQGRSNDEICDSVGWRGHASLNRYRQLDRVSIVSCGCLDEILKEINYRSEGRPKSHSIDAEIGSG